MITLVRFLIGWLFTFIYWAVAIFFFLATFNQLTDFLLIPALRFWARTCLLLVRVRVELVNPCNFTGPEPRVVICNHQSMLDILWGCLVLPPGAMAIGKREMIFVPIINILWWLMKNIRIDRKNLKKSLRTMEGVAAEINLHSRSLFIAPEGTRTPHGEILPFKKGPFHIALQAKVPIYPFVVAGAYELLPKHALMPKPGVIRIRFLEPVPMADKNPEDFDALIPAVRNDMIRAFQEIKNTLPCKVV